MKRTFFTLPLIVIALFALSACASPTPETDITPTPITVLNPVIPNTPTPAFSCTSITTEATPVPDSASLFPPVSGADFSIGPADAPVTIIEYCDFQSQGCAGMASVIDRLMQNNKSIRFVFRPLPLIGVLDKSEQAVLAALAADEQGKFWEMHDLLFTKYNEWANLGVGGFDTWVLDQASAAGMDADQFSAAMKAGETRTRMMSMYDAAKQLEIPAVPLIVINGVIQQSYVLDYQSMSDTIGLILLGQKQFTECPPFSIDVSKQYIATIETEKGNIVIELLPDKAPLAVNSFVFLARQGWYDGVTFHRVIPGFAAQTGDPSGTGRGNPGYFFQTEISDLLFDRPGLVGMANSGPDTNGSQFFITFAPAAHLNGSYTIFGRVLSGLDVAEKLTPRDPSQPINLPAGDRIIKIIMEEK